MNQRHFILNNDFTKQLLQQFNSPETIKNKEIEIINAWFKKTFDQTFNIYAPAIIADPTKKINLEFTKEQIETLNLYKYVQKNQFTKKGILIKSRPFIALNKQNDYIRKLKSDFDAFVINYITENNLFHIFHNNYETLLNVLLNTIKPNGYHRMTLRYDLEDNCLIYITNKQICISIKPRYHFIPDWLIEQELTKRKFNDLTKNHTSLTSLFKH